MKKSIIDCAGKSNKKRITFPFLLINMVISLLLFSFLHFLFQLPFTFLGKPFKEREVCSSFTPSCSYLHNLLDFAKL